MAKKDGRNRTASSQAVIREQVVDYLKKGRGSQREAAEIFGLHIRSVNRIWALYRKGGLRLIREKKRGVREGKKLSGKQAGEVKRLIRDKHPEQIKLSYALWTREAVRELIEHRYGVSLSRWQVGRYLKSWGYTPQKPIRRAFEQKPEQVKRWLEAEYPAIKRKAAKEKGVIYFGDETGMRSDHQAGRSYAPKGQTPVIPSTGKRFSLNMISAISHRGHLQFMIIERFNSLVFLDFLKRLTRYSRQKVFFVTDNHPVHKSRTVQEWMERNRSKIEVFFIPPFSPELNPQEYLNQDVKTNVIGKKRPINQAQMRENVEDFMKGKKSDKTLVKKYFHHKKVRYALQN